MTLGEGNTPLVASVRIGPARGAQKLYFKLEGCNPSGSYKDRFIAAQISLMIEAGVTTCVATSSGNTGSALAAYCARAGIRCFVLVNEDAPAGKLMQMQAHGAKVLRIPGFTVDAAITASVLDQLGEFSRDRCVPLVVSAFRYCPGGMAGVEAIAGELRAQCVAIEHVFVPVGGGGLYCAVVQGFERLGVVPRVHAVQPAGCSTVAAAFERGDGEIRPVRSTTRISGLAVPYDIDASLALRHLRACGGHGFAVEDEEALVAQRMLMEQEGIFCEPAGATALAGWLRAIESGVAGPEQSSVCLVTAHGFKDPASLQSAASRNPTVLVEPLAVGRFLSQAQG